MNRHWMRYLILLLATALLGVAVPASVAQAADAQMTLEKTVSQDVVQPGEEFGYEIELSCSSLTVGCVDATISDVIPAGFDVTSLPDSNAEREVTYDPGTRLLTVKFIMALSNPPGTTGLPAGAARKVAIGLRLPVDTDIPDGQTITNTAEAEADNADDPPPSSVDVTVDIPVVVRPVATKTWEPATGIAQTGAESVITLGVRNNSSSTAEVDELSVTDTSTSTFDAFNVTQLGPVTTYPPGTDRVIVETCTLPIGTPCADGDWQAAAPQSGNAPLTPPAGVALADITGVRFTFVDSNGNPIPRSADQGTVELHVQLRDNYRSTNAPIDPTEKTRVTNCAAPSATDSGGAVTTGAEVCAPFDIIPDQVTIKATKDIFPDQNGDYTSDGAIVVGQNSGVSMTITGENNSGIPMDTMTLREPGSPSEFDKIDITKGRFTFPAGTSTAELTVDCRSGTDPTTATFTKPPATVDIANFGCDPGVFPASISVKFFSTGPGATILPTQTGVLQLHGAASGVTEEDVANQLQNCAEAVANGGTPSSATATGCDQTPVQNPNPGISGSKNSSGVTTIVPGQPMAFRLTFRNSGNIPLTNVVLQDPADPQAANNPFDIVRLLNLTASTSPTSTLEVWDPDKVGGAGYVPYAAGDTALLTRSKGIRVTLTQALPVGATFQVDYNVMLRDGIETGVSFQNCAVVNGDGATSGNFCGSQITSELPDAAAALQKIIDPGSVIRPTPGLPAQNVTVKHRLKNTGTLYLSALGVTDTDADFFDAVTFAGNVRVNFPPGANRVQVDVCTSDCATPTWILGTPTASQSPSIPAGVSAADVKGIRVTFSVAGGGFGILPGENYPSGGNCPSASVCFRVNPRATLASNGQPIPDQLSDTSTGSMTSSLGTSPLPDVTDTLDVIEGDAQLKITKGPESRIGPGDVAPIDLVVENTGTSPVTDLEIVDPLPAQLTFVPGDPPHYSISYDLPVGADPPPTVTYTEIPDPDNPNRVGKLRWQFPGWALPVGGEIKVSFKVKLTPGTPAAAVITNTAGTHGSNQNLTCSSPNQSATDNPLYGDGLFCLDDTTITSLSGNAVEAAKYSSGDPALGFYNTLTDTIEAVDAQNPVCPHFTFADVVYTRYPCVPQVYPGQEIKWLVRLTNAGTNQLVSSTLIDGLPVEGDTGVLLSGQQRGTQWDPRPTMLTPVTLQEAVAGVTTTYTDTTFPGPDFCTTPLNNSPTPCPGSAFPNADPSESTTGFQTVMALQGDPLAPGESTTFTYSMRAPLWLEAPNANPVAWNSFAQKSTFTRPGGGTQALPATEPIKAGVIMPFGLVKVSKSVVGLPEGVPLQPFAMAYKCRVTPAGGEPTVVDEGTFTVADGDTHTLPLQPAGADCGVWETNTQGGTTPNDSEANAAHVTVVPAQTQPAGVEVTITNTYQTGGLTVSKTVTGDPVLPLPGSFGFRVTCSFNGSVLPDYPVTFELDDTESHAIQNLPAGASCVVEETDSQHATSTGISVNGGDPVEGTSVTVTITAGAQAVTVAYDNQYDVGALRINKTLSGDAVEWATGPYKFAVHCETGLGDIDRTVTLTPENLEATISPLPVGAVCTVTETDAGDADVETPVAIDTVTIPPNGLEGPVTVTVTADNPYPAGYVEVTKQTSGPAADLMADAEFTVHVTCRRTVSGTTQNYEEDVRLNAGDTVRLDTPLPLGMRCWGTETDTAGATSSSVDYDSFEDSVEITEETPVVALTASNVYDAGGLHLTKSLEGPAVEYAQGPEYTFEVRCTLGGISIATQELTLTPDNLSASLDSLPVGASCEVWETGQGDATGTVPRLIDTVVIPPSASAAVEVHAVNDYPAGHVTVSKVVDGGAAGLVTDAEFAIRMQCERDLVGGGTETILDRTVTLHGGESVTFSEPLPMGARCWGEETITGGATSVVIDHGSPEAAVTVTTETPEVSVTATNTFDAGSLVINKTLSGDASEWAQGPYVFSVRCTLAGLQLAHQTVTLTPDNLTGTVSPLPVGASCAVWETHAGDASVEVPRLIDTVVIPPASAGPVTVSADNPYPRGTLSVTKVVDGDAADQMGAARFEVRLLCRRATGTELILDKTVTLRAGETKTLSEPLPMGARCWGRELDAAGATSSKVEPGSLADAVVITEEASQVNVLATNTYDTGELVVKKKVKRTGGVKVGPFSFSVDCVVKANGHTWKVQLPKEDARFTLNPNEQRRIKVPAGAHCTVKETRKDGAGKVTMTVDGEKSNGRVTVDDQVIVRVLNDYTGTIIDPDRHRRPHPDPDPGPAPDNGGDTPSATGANVGPALLLAAALLLAGAGLVLFGRRRRKGA